MNGTGPFKFVQHQPGAFVEGVKNDDYHHEGQPYLDGFRAIIAKKMSVRIQAIRGNRAAIEFRGFPPKARDDLVNALGDKITVQESNWNCALFFTSNHEREPFSDPRVRRALTLAVDRWGGSKYLSQIAIVKTVGGIVFPGHPLAASQEELEGLAGYSRDLEASRAEAMALLKEAGATDLVIDYNNRDVDQPYKVVGTWLIDQWAQIGVKAEQQVRPTPQFYAALRKSHEFDVSIDFNCQSVINPIADVQVPRQLRQQLRAVRRPGAGGHLRKLARAGVGGRAAHSHASVREAGARRGGTHGRHAVVVQDQPPSLVREGVDRAAEPLPQPAARQRLDRQASLM